MRASLRNTARQIEEIHHAHSLADRSWGAFGASKVQWFDLRGSTSRMRFGQREGVGVTSSPDRRDGLSSRGTSRSPGLALLQVLAAGSLGFAIGEIARFETRKLELALLMLCLLPTSVGAEAPQDADPARTIRAGGFALAASGARFVPWGFNYDHDENGRLLEDYWDTEWPKVDADFREMKDLGANVVRVHLQLGKFMKARPSPIREVARPAGEAAGSGRADRPVPGSDRPGLLSQDATCPPGTTRSMSRRGGPSRPGSGRPSPPAVPGARPCSATT